MASERIYGSSAKDILLSSAEFIETKEFILFLLVILVEIYFILLSILIPS